MYKYRITNPSFLNTNVLCNFLRKRESLKFFKKFHLIMNILE